MIGLNDLYDLFDLFKLLEQKCSLFTHKRFELFKFLSSQLNRYYRAAGRWKRLEGLNTGLYTRLDKSWGAKSGFMY